MELRQRRGAVTPRQGKEGKESQEDDENAKVGGNTWGTRDCWEKTMEMFHVSIFSTWDRLSYDSF